MQPYLNLCCPVQRQKHSWLDSFVSDCRWRAGLALTDWHILTEPVFALGAIGSIRMSSGTCCWIRCLCRTERLLMRTLWRNHTNVSARMRKGCSQQKITSENVSITVKTMTLGIQSARQLAKMNVQKTSHTDLNCYITQFFLENQLNVHYCTVNLLATTGQGAETLYRSRCYTDPVTFQARDNTPAIDKLINGYKKTQSCHTHNYDDYDPRIQ